MSLSRSLRCVFAASKSSSTLRAQRRCLHSSSRLQEEDDQGPSTKDLSTTPSRIPTRSTKKRATAADFPAYTEKERQKLKEKYTPEQIAAIEAGEAAINPQDIADHGVIRTGHMSLDYLDDFAQIRPVIDQPRRAPEENYDPDARFKEDDEIAEDLAHWMGNLPENADPVEWRKYSDNVRLTVGKEEAENNPRDYTAPEIPKLKDPLVRSVARMSKNANEDDEMAIFWERLSRQTGMDVSTMRGLRHKVLVSHGVTNQTRMGKVRSMYYLTVAGNGKGLLGIGEGKSSEPEDARRQSRMNAIRNMQPIARYEDRTIYGDVKGKVGATELELYNRPPGSSFHLESRVRERVLTILQDSAFDVRTKSTRCASA